MGPALQTLAIRSATSFVGAATSTAQGAIQNFVEIFSDAAESQPASSTSSATDSASAISQIHATIRDHLQRIGLPIDESFQIEVGVTGQIHVNSDSPNRPAIEEAIKGDQQLISQLRSSAYHQPTTGFPALLHWPPSEA